MAVSVQDLINGFGIIPFERSLPVSTIGPLYIAEVSLGSLHIDTVTNTVNIAEVSLGSLHSDPIADSGVGGGVGGGGFG